MQIKNDKDKICYSDRDSYRLAKQETESEMREKLQSSRQTAFIADAAHFKIFDNLGFRTTDPLNINVLEQILPTEYYILHDFVETNRKED